MLEVTSGIIFNEAKLATKALTTRNHAILGKRASIESMIKRLSLTPKQTVGFTNENHA